MWVACPPARPLVPDRCRPAAASALSGCCASCSCRASATSVNGNQNWINFGGPFRIQPSEAAKLALVLWSADVLGPQAAGC